MKSSSLARWQAQVRARSEARRAKRTEVRARRLRDWAHCDQRRVQSWARRHKARLIAVVCGRFKAVVPALRAIYRAKDAEAGIKALDAFDAGPWGQKYPAIAQSWRRNWDHVVPFFAFPENVRRIIYTTNAIEALNAKLRRAVRTMGHFPNDDAAMKLLYLVLNHAAEQRKRPPREWFEAKTQFAVIFGERFVIQ
jgi:transposase-like protein